MVKSQSNYTCCTEESLLDSGSVASDFAPDWPGKHPASYSMGSVAYYPGMTRPEREAYHSPTFTGFKNEWSYTSIPPYVFMPCTGRTLPTPLP